ncbi:hypothetical protein CVT24_006534, partial [Panaeolus cyanescens]
VIRGIWFPNSRQKLDQKAASQAKREKILPLPMILLASTAIAHVIREYAFGTKPSTNTDFTEDAIKLHYHSVRQYWEKIQEQEPAFDRYTRKKLFTSVAADFNVLEELTPATLAPVDFAAMRAKFSEMGDMSDDNDSHADNEDAAVAVAPGGQELEGGNLEYEDD